MISMQIHIIPIGNLKVRATEMIKPLSQKKISDKYPIDTEGSIMLAMNALLVIEEEQVVLMDPGCADFLPPRLLKEYGFHIDIPLEEELSKVGIMPHQVTDVIFTHLHFDHGSGAFKRQPGKIVKRFRQARYHVLKAHYEYATHPDSKEAGSFFTSLLKYVDQVHWLEEWDSDWLTFQIFEGHTRHMTLPIIKSNDERIYFLADLIPMEIFMDLNVFSGYDRDPRLAVQEKREFLAGLNGSAKLVFFHDPLTESLIYS